MTQAIHANRRAILGYAATAAATFGFIPAGRRGSVTGPDAARATPRATAQRVDQLRVAVQGLPISMDPHVNSGNLSSRVQYFVYDTLLERDFVNAGLKPRLASEWRRIDDRSVEVALRPGVTWQDGAPFTAHDVAFTFERLQSGDPRFIYAANLLPLERVEAVDDLTVRFVAPTTDPTIENKLALTDHSMLPAHYLPRVGDEGFLLAPLGTGPYRVTELVDNDRYTCQAHDGYFGGRPAARSVIVREIPELATRMAAVQNGEVDLITNILPDLAAELERDASLAVKRVQLANMFYLAFNQQAAPLGRREIRQALSLAIDRRRSLMAFGEAPRLTHAASSSRATRSSIQIAL